MTEGRSCPLAYRYQPDALCQDPVWVNDDVIYVIGGLYGNPLALDEIERMALAEEQAGHRVVTQRKEPDGLVRVLIQPHGNGN